MDNEQPADKSPAVFFEKMAERIRHNSDDVFGGAFVIVPPSGEPVSAFLSAGSDLAQFYVWLQGQVTKAINEADQSRRGFGR